MLENPKDRHRYLVFMIQVLRHLRSWNDFNGVILIFGGITNSSVHRLSVWHDIDESVMHELEALRVITNPHRNAKELRASMEEAGPPCLPYVNVFLRDLIFTNDGNPSHRPNSEGVLRLNRRKAELSAGIVRNVQRLSRKASHQFENLHEVQELLLSCPLLAGSQLDVASRWVEPHQRSRPDTKPEFLVSSLNPTSQRWEPSKVLIVFVILLSILIGALSHIFN